MDELRNEKERRLSDWIYQHSNLIFRTAFYYVKDQMIAQDITQEVFLKAYKNMEDYRRDSAVSSWLYRITVNTCKDYLRTWNLRKMFFTNDFSSQGTSDSAEHAVIKKINEDALVQQVMKLPVKYREVIVLYYFENMKSHEIADLLRLKDSTVRARIQRAKAKLKQELGGEAHGLHGRTI